MRKLAEMEQYLQQIREFTAMTPDEDSSDWKAQRIVETTLHLMIERCVPYLQNC